MNISQIYLLQSAEVFSKRLPLHLSGKRRKHSYWNSPSLSVSTVKDDCDHRGNNCKNHNNRDHSFANSEAANTLWVTFGRKWNV